MVTYEQYKNSSNSCCLDDRDNGSGNSRNGNTVTALIAKNKGSASGFDTNVTQEAENAICTHPSTNCISEGSGTPVVNNTSSDDNSDDDGVGHG